MMASRIVTALALPEGALVEQRVPKKLMLAHGAPTAADKRAIRDGIEAVYCTADLREDAQTSASPMSGWSCITLRSDTPTGRLHRCRTPL